MPSRNPMSTKWYKAVERQAARNPKLVWGSLLGLGGLLYVKAWLPLTNIGIPCLFHEATGLYCPGCGITRALSSALNLDFEEAFRYNSLLFLLAPMYVAYTAANKKKWNLFSRLIMAAMIAATLLFGLLRNFPSFDWLAPGED